MSFTYDPNFTPWGPFIRKEGFLIQPLPQAAFIGATTIFALTGVFACSTASIAIAQTRRSRRPWSSGYIWMIWAEWASCVALALICFLHLLRVIRPNFYFYFFGLVFWTIQTQCLLQIIINRIRIILQDRRKGKRLQIATFVFWSLINISVFCIWIPARLQISAKIMHINEIWDRVEKAVYLIIDAALNVFFIRTVKENLISNGLQKYNRLVKFNQAMIAISLLMDVLLIASMSIPNGFVFTLFHPFTYLVKLNIELSMARLIKKIALGSNGPQSGRVFPSFNSSTDKASKITRLGEWAAKQGMVIKNAMHADSSISKPESGAIKRTEEYTVSSEPIELRSQKFDDSKNVQISVSRKDDTRAAMIGVYRATKESKDGREVRTRELMGDEEVLIKPQPVLLPSRRSADSSTTHSMASINR
ncbi:hypothetical protein FB567DRAFT_436690 [Paraphoma chrysanthemicola]|uniref:Uncharacterized protein n=1 Tax=Paraphoma chrysanthemicola TaxID=798071 RepID=A0A8K0W2T0_9PLEO|nr:hypothetical protein FB567DRAFT_436690 [Paraphoma chrysanthemicola]